MSKQWTGANVSQLRRGIGLSKTQLGLRIGRTPRTIADWESNPQRVLPRQISQVLSHLADEEIRKRDDFKASFASFTQKHLVREVGRYVSGETIYLEYLAFAKLEHTAETLKDFSRYYRVTQDEPLSLRTLRPDLAIINPPSGAPQIPQQVVGVRFQQASDGRIDLARGEPLSDAETRRLAHLHMMLRDAARELLNRIGESNGYRGLLRQAKLYLDALDRPAADLRDGDIELAYGAGLALQGAQETLKRDIANGYAPPEDVALAAPLNQVLGLQGPFLQSTSRGLELYEQTDRDRRTHDEDLLLRQRQSLLNEKLAATPGLVTPEAQEAIEVMTDAMAQGRQEPRANAAGRSAIRNLWSYLTRVAASARTHTSMAGGVGAFLLTGSVAKSKVGAAALVAGGATIDAVAGGAGQAAFIAHQFLLENALLIKAVADAGGTTFGWLSSAIDWLKMSLAARSTKSYGEQMSRASAYELPWKTSDLLEVGGFALPLNTTLEVGKSLTILFPGGAQGILSLDRAGEKPYEWYAHWECHTSRYHGREFFLYLDQQEPSGLLAYIMELLPLSPKTD